jgi:alpha-L-fucosidase
VLGRFALAAAGLLACGALAPVQAGNPSANQAAREWFQDSRFGMFIHWGAYSVPARGEWVMEHEHIPASEYEKLAAQFNPTQFSARDIVSLAKRAGMKYITITSKHHDGFAMWETHQSHWNIVDATPCKQDPLKALSAEAHRRGGKLFLYYSLLDWHSTDYWPLGCPPGGDFDRYLDYMDAQLTELLTQYGPVGGIWSDGMWDKPDGG